MQESPPAQTKNRSTVKPQKSNTRGPTQIENEAETIQLLAKARESSYTDNYAQTITITKQILGTESTCGEAWLIHGIALFRQNEKTLSTKLLRQVLLHMIQGYRNLDTNHSDSPADIVEPSFSFAIDRLVTHEAKRYEEKRNSGSAFVTFINELTELQNLYDAIYVTHSHTERTYTGNKLAYACSSRSLEYFKKYGAGKNSTAFLDGMSECIAVAQAVVQYCGEAGDPRSAYYRLQHIHEYLTDDLWSPTPAMRSLGATIAGHEHEYRLWETQYFAFDEDEFEIRAAFWKEHRNQWCALYLELDRVKNLFNIQPRTTAPEIRNALQRRINQLAAYLDIDDPSGIENKSGFLANIDNLTKDTSGWCDRCKQAITDVTKINETIKANWWFFGESARIRKEAQQQKEQLMKTL